MEYVFGRLPDGSQNLMVKSKAETDLAGRTEIRRDFDDCFIIDNFYAGEKYKTETDSEGIFYDWYNVSDHGRTIDYSKKLEPQIQSNSDSIDEILKII